MTEDIVLEKQSGFENGHSCMDYILTAAVTYKICSIRIAVESLVRVILLLMFVVFPKWPGCVRNHGL